MLNSVSTIQCDDFWYKRSVYIIYSPISTYNHEISHTNLKPSRTPQTSVKGLPPPYHRLETRVQQDFTLNIVYKFLKVFSIQE